MKKFFQKIVSKLFKKAVSKSVSDVVANSPEVVPVELPVDGGKKSLWKFIIQTIISKICLGNRGAFELIFHI